MYLSQGQEPLSQPQGRCIDAAVHQVSSVSQLLNNKESSLIKKAMTYYVFISEPGDINCQCHGSCVLCNGK